MPIIPHMHVHVQLQKGAGTALVGFPLSPPLYRRLPLPALLLSEDASGGLLQGWEGQADGRCVQVTGC